MENEDKTTLYALADEFYYAAVELEKSENKNMMAKPSYYLYAHAIELAYKSFLFHHGATLDFLKRRIGHNLEKALEKSKEKGFDGKLADDPKYTTTIKELNKYYYTKEFEYMTKVAKTLPLLDDVKNAAQQTINAAFDTINGFM